MRISSQYFAFELFTLLIYAGYLFYLGRSFTKAYHLDITTSSFLPTELVKLGAYTTISGKNCQSSTDFVGHKKSIIEI